ncbi:MAG: hypothetical protein CMJ76_11315 [Planctomycetaceae bacterium]|nr:hypothetical protein [Planctomycetaceae bacterium]
MRFLIPLVFCVLTVNYNLLAEPAMRPGDRVTFLGGTFVERMQIHGHFEAEIRSRLDGDIQFRNLGWAGDNVLGESRAVFGTVEKGMERLLRDMELTDPTVIVICYGANEAHAGQTGLTRFSENLSSLTTRLKNYEARLIFVAPRPYERLGIPLPNPASYNAMLSKYSAIIRKQAERTNSHFIDLATLEPVVTTEVLQSSTETGPWILEEHHGLTSNGVHLTSFGYWRLASSFANALGLTKQQILIAPLTESRAVSGLTFEKKNQRITIRGELTQMSLPPIENSFGLEGPQVTFQLGNLEPNRYQVFAGKELLGVFNSRDLAKGITIPAPLEVDKVNAFRNAIIQKNMLFFHRHRPQNETYLFLFRKHEQGNNAIEVPQFDELVDNYDRKIYELSNNNTFTITVSPLK